MRTHPPIPHVLRLVNTVDDRQQRVSPRTIAPRRATRAVERENRSAAVLPADDARRIFGDHVARSLEGGRAAILRPDRRRLLVSRAATLGLRPFDANLIIAIVQDGARRGDSTSGQPLVRMVKPVRTRAAGVYGPACAAVLLATVLLAALMWWVR
jgi:hypothetical protein